MAAWQPVILREKRQITSHERNNCATVEQGKSRSKVRQRQCYARSHSIGVLSFCFLAMRREVHLLKERGEKSLFWLWRRFTGAQKAQSHLVPAFGTLCTHTKSLFCYTDVFRFYSCVVTIKTESQEGTSDFNVFEDSYLFSFPSLCIPTQRYLYSAQRLW